MTQDREIITVSNLDPETTDANDMLQLKGFFRLAQVCRCLIFEPYQLRTQAQRGENQRREMGVFFHKPVNGYLVDMPVFAKWITKLWLGPHHP